MRNLTAVLLCIFFAGIAYGQDTTARKPISLHHTIQLEIGASAGFVFPGAVESTLPKARAYKAGMFLFRGNVNFNKHNRPLYFTTALHVGLMPFSSWGSIPSATPPFKPLAEYQNEYLVTSFAIVPGAQLQVPVGKATKFCIGIGAGGMLQLHGYQRDVQKNIILESNIGLMTEDMTAVGIRFYHPYNGLEEHTVYYDNSYLLTGVLFEFRQRLSRNGRKK